MLGILVGCGGGSDEFEVSCEISRAELGPFASDQPVGKRFADEAEARAAMAETGFEEWIEIRASGTWDQAWDLATPILGQGIHTSLSWLDADGVLTDLYEPGDSYTFADLRVSRSFQSKIEHADTPLFIGVDSTLGEPNFGDARCDVTALIVGDEQNDNMLDVLDAVALPAET